jgi:hypothetical protein
MIRVACTWNKRIRAGHPNKDGLSFRCGGDDVTSDVLKAIIEYVQPGNSITVTENGVPMFEIEVRMSDAAKGSDGHD